MVFQEKKTEQGYEYTVEDVFGKIEIASSQQLTGEILDDMVVLLLRKNLNAEVVTGEVKHKGGVVTYKFHRASTWSEDDEEPCENTPTSTEKQESGSTATNRWRVPILSWCRRFAVAFREAWRSAKSYQQPEHKSGAGKN